MTDFDSTKHPRASAGTFTERAFSAPEVDLTAAASAPENMTVAELMAETGPDFWAGLAEDEKTPPAILSALARAAEPETRRLVAGNPGISVELLDTLSRDPDIEVRSATMNHPSADEEFLTRFRSDLDDFDVVYALCQRSSDPDLLRELAKNDYTPLYVIAANPAAPDDLLDTFAAGTDLFVRSSILTNPAVTEARVDAASRDEDPQVRAKAVYHRKISRSALIALATDPVPAVRATVARCHYRDTEIRGILEKDPNETVRGLVASMKGTW